MTDAIPDIAVKLNVKFQLLRGKRKKFKMDRWDRVVCVKLVRDFARNTKFGTEKNPMVVL